MLKLDFEECINRYEGLYGGKRSVLIQIPYIQEIYCSPGYPNVKMLYQWRFPEQLREFLDASLAAARYYYRARYEVEDDTVPSVMARFGIAEHSAFLGGTAEFSENTSWHNHPIKKWSDRNGLSMDENNLWFRLVMDGMDYYREQAKDDVAVRLRGAGSPAELAMFLRGNEIYTDFYDAPEEVKNLIEYCIEASKFYIGHQMKRATKIRGGYVNGFECYQSGNSFGQLSEDWAVMVSPAVYQEFGKPYTEKLIAAFDQAYMHLHSVAPHLIPLVAQMEKITHIEIADDPNARSGFALYQEMEEVLKGKVVTVNMTYDEIRDNAAFLSRNKTVVKCAANTVAEAKEIVKLARQIG